MYPMQSNQHNSAILNARQKPVVGMFSEKAVHNYSAYQSVNTLGGNPMLVVNNSKFENIGVDEPKTLIRNQPKKQGKIFKLELGQNVSWLF